MPLVALVYRHPSPPVEPVPGNVHRSKLQGQVQTYSATLRRAIIPRRGSGDLRDAISAPKQVSQDHQMIAQGHTGPYMHVAFIRSYDMEVSVLGSVEHWL